jgi:hypothetical protein
MEFECLHCKKEFEVEKPFKKNITCHHCGCIMGTDMASSGNNLYFWITRVSPDSPVQ